MNNYVLLVLDDMASATGNVIESLICNINISVMVLSDIELMRSMQSVDKRLISTEDMKYLVSLYRRMRYYLHSINRR